jgi:alkylation response protein AidB-like acyl-CoA dehydrogenase
VVSGQKVWTSWAREADWCMLLVRTDPDATKHKGISCLAVDMRSPGIDVRPIRQAWGPADFNEVFFDEVDVPVENLIGEENRGWSVAQGTLAAERAVAILEMAERLRCHGIGAAVAEAASWRLEGGQPALDDGLVRERLAERLAEVHVLRHLLDGMIDDILRGADVSGTSSIIKVFYSELLAGLTKEMTDIQGLAGQVDAGVLACAGWETGFWMNDYIHSFGWLIGGGTNEIQRNVIGERMLGLPRQA